ADAREFFDAYAKRTWRRYPKAESADIEAAEERNADNAAGPSPPTERREWYTNEGRVVVELQGARVLIIEGIPDKADTTALLKASWQ
ncbi:MAG TPA: hypothetical protein VFD48_02005, partial [Pyrinomonadaceae bacterium]|nr:hypothetical protein [Pyrinomonadaceae bacterium]